MLNSSAVTCYTGPYRMAVFTSVDDWTCGDTITGSSGTISNYYGNGLKTSSATLHDLRFRYSYQAIEASAHSSLIIQDSQFVNCKNALHADDSDEVIVENSLFANLNAVIDGGPANFTGTQLTIDRVTAFGAFSSGSNNTLSLTNSILTSVTNTSGSFGFNTFNNDPDSLVRINEGDQSFFPPYQTVGAGAYYLAYDSNSRGVGRTSIGSSLLQRLSHKTTYAPAVFPTNITANTTLGPAIPRDDTSAPDLGYHYDPIDYCFNQIIVTNATLVLTNGITVAVFGSKGIILKTGGNLVCEGTPYRPNHYTRFSTVQEQAFGWGGRTTGMTLLEPATANTTAKFKCSDFSVLSDSSNRRQLWLVYPALTSTFTVTDSIIRNAQIYLQGSPGTMSFACTNNVFEGSICALHFGYLGTAYSINAYVYNNLFHYGQFVVDYVSSYSVCSIRDNLFDTVSASITVENPGTYPLPASNNGFWSTSTFGTGNISLSTIDYQAGLLSRYYYPQSGSSGLATLINAGSRNVSAAGLSSYTTSTDQTTDSSTVDIGYHSLSVTTNTTVTLVAKDSAASEAGHTGTFTVSRIGITNTDLAVLYSVEGLAANGVDYSTLSGSVTIPNGSTSTDITVTPIADSELEFNENVTLKLVFTNAYLFGAQDSGTVIIQDTNDPAVTTFPLPSPTGVDFHPIINKVVSSVNQATSGAGTNFVQIASDGTFTRWSPVSGLSDETKIAIAQQTANNFPQGSMYYGTGIAGQIGRLSADGTGFTNSWVNLSGESALLRGGLFIDQTGIFGNDLIAVSGPVVANTNGGSVYRITGSGSSSFVTQLTNLDGTAILSEGVTTLTNDSAKYGPLAGTILVACEGNMVFKSIDALTNVLTWNFTMVPESAKVIIPNKAAYFVGLDTNSLFKIASSAFTTFPGQILAVSEQTLAATDSRLKIVRWTGAYFILRSIAIKTSAGFEGVAFGPD